MVPIDPEPRSDLYKDGRTVMILRKQYVDHEFGSRWAMLVRRDGHKWLIWIGLVGLMVWTLATVVWSLARYIL